MVLEWWLRDAVPFTNLFNERPRLLGLQARVVLPHLDFLKA